VFDDELVLILPNSFSRDRGDAHENFAEYILGAPFIMREAGSGTRAEIEGLLSKIGVDLRDLHIPAYFSDAHSILLAVARGMGVSLVSKMAAAMYVEAGLLTAVEMTSDLFMRKIFLLYNKELWLSPAQQAFADHARQIAPKSR
jgi:DNA-binding transcriptional LysR family regulator